MMHKKVDFADRLAGAIEQFNLRKGRVFAMCGRWGFGKSSLKNLQPVKTPKHSRQLRTDALPVDKQLALAPKDQAKKPNV